LTKQGLNIKLYNVKEARMKCIKVVFIFLTILCLGCFGGSNDKSDVTAKPDAGGGGNKPIAAKGNLPDNLPLLEGASILAAGTSGEKPVVQIQADNLNKVFADYRALLKSSSWNEYGLLLDNESVKQVQVTKDGKKWTLQFSQVGNNIVISFQTS
jgi:hypothetical protein